jgi:hypothetical protein
LLVALPSYSLSFHRRRKTGSASMPVVGEICHYRSISGNGVFDAKIVVVHPDGRVDAEVWLPDGKVAMTRHRIMYSEDPGFSPKGSAFQKDSVGETETWAK